MPVKRKSPKPAKPKKLPTAKAAVPKEQEAKTAAFVPQQQVQKIEKEITVREPEKREIAPEPTSSTLIKEPTMFVQETAPEPMAFKGEETKAFEFAGKEKLVTTFTAGGVVLSFWLSVGSVLVVPAWPAGAGLMATLGVISCFGAFMARETI